MHDNDAIFDKTGRFRYVLSRRPDPSSDPMGKRLLWVMVNPSTADAANDDSTIRKCKGYTKRWGYSYLRVVNLFAFRAKDINELKRESKKYLDIVGADNDFHIDNNARWSDDVVCAWGDRKKIPPSQAVQRPLAVYGILKQVQEDFSKHGKYKSIMCLGLTNGGDPLHPLMTSYALERQEFSYAP